MSHMEFTRVNKELVTEDVLSLYPIIKDTEQLIKIQELLCILEKLYNINLSYITAGTILNGTIFIN